MGAGVDEVRGHAMAFKRMRHLLKRGECAAIPVWASIDEQDLHGVLRVDARAMARRGGGQWAILGVGQGPKRAAKAWKRGVLRGKKRLFEE